MSRVVLYLPVIGLALPLLTYLFLAPPPPEAGTPSSSEDLPVPKVSDEGALPSQERMDELAQTDVIAFLENALRRYHREIHGYHLIMQKQERLAGKLHPRELIEVLFREQPFSVYLRWLEGARLAERALYVEGENNGNMLVLPSGVLRYVGVVERDPEGKEAHQSGRFTMKQYGLRKATERYLASWTAAREEGTLNVKCVGVHAVKEADNRVCYHFHRVCAKPENDGVMEQTLFMDREWWLQVGSIIKGEGGQLIGEYYFRDIHLNPQFKPDQFQRAALTR